LLSEVPVPLDFTEEGRQESQQLRNRLLWWRFRRWPQISVDPSLRIPGIDLRLQQIAKPLLACLEPNNPARQVVLESVQGVGQYVREERADSLQGRLLRLMVGAYKRSPQDDRWLVSTLTGLLNDGRPERRQYSEETIGRTVKGLGFRWVRGPGKSAAYEFDESLLRRQCDAYGIEPPPAPSSPGSSSVDPGVLW